MNGNVSFFRKFKTFIVVGILMFCYFGRYFITVGIQAMLLNIILNVFVIVYLGFILFNIWRKNNTRLNKLIGIIICIGGIIVFGKDAFPYIIDIVGNNREEVISKEYSVLYSKGREHSNYYLNLNDINKVLRIDHKLYAKFKYFDSYDYEIRITYWVNSRIIDEIEFVDGE